MSPGQQHAIDEAKETTLWFYVKCVLNSIKYNIIYICIYNYIYNNNYNYIYIFILFIIIYIICIIIYIIIYNTFFAQAHRSFMVQLASSLNSWLYSLVQPAKSGPMSPPYFVISMGSHLALKSSSICTSLSVVQRKIASCSLAQALH